MLFLIPFAGVLSFIFAEVCQSERTAMLRGNLALVTRTRRDTHFKRSVAWTPTRAPTPTCRAGERGEETLFLPQRSKVQCTYQRKESLWVLFSSFLLIGSSTALLLLVSHHRLASVAWFSETFATQYIFDTINVSYLNVCVAILSFLAGRR